MYVETAALGAARRRGMRIWRTCRMKIMGLEMGTVYARCEHMTVEALLLENVVGVLISQERIKISVSIQRPIRPSRAIQERQRKHRHR